MKRLATLLLACTATTAFAQTPGTPAFTAEGVRAHVEFLADDLLEGRDIGSRGHEIAARYVASEFDALGLKPAGDDGTWNQRTTFHKTSPGQTPPTPRVTAPGGPHDTDHCPDAVIRPTQHHRRRR